MAPSTRKRKASTEVAEENEHEKPNAFDDTTIPNESEETVVDQGVSEYERLRLENIKRNEMFLSGLGLAEVKPPSSSSSKSTKVKGNTTSSKGLKVPQLPTRRSTRVTVDKLAAEVKQLKDEGKYEEAAIKQIELDELAKTKEATYQAEFIESNVEKYERILDEKIPLTAILGYEDEDAEEERNQLAKACLDTITLPSATSSDRKSSKTKSTKPVTYLPYAQLRLHEGDIAKMAPNRLTAAYLHPTEHKYLAMAGDKNGYIGIWDVDYGKSHATTSSTTLHEGIYKYRTNISNIIAFHCNHSHDERMYIASYDGTIRYFDFTQEGFTLAFHAPEDISDMYVSDVSFAWNTPHHVYLSKSNGYMSFVDLRTTSQSYIWDVQGLDGRITSIQQHPTDANYLITAGTKGFGIDIHDLRKLHTKAWKPVTSLTLHSKSINAAYVSPDGTYITSVSQDDTIRVWRDFLSNKSTSACKVIKHNNITGRWLSTFRPAFDPKHPSCFVMGSMQQPRRIEVFGIRSKGEADYEVSIVQNLQSEYLNSVNSRNCFHPTLNAVLGSNSSGKVHLFREF